jgi:hypothetical protein
MSPLSICTFCKENPGFIQDLGEPGYLKKDFLPYKSTNCSRIAAQNSFKIYSLLYGDMLSLFLASLKTRMKFDFCSLIVIIVNALKFFLKIAILKFFLTFLLRYVPGTC